MFNHLKIGIMQKFTVKQLKSLIVEGAAIDVTHAISSNEIPESYTQIGYAEGIYGCTGMLLKGKSGKLYAVAGRTTAIYMF